MNFNSSPSYKYFNAKNNIDIPAPDSQQDIIKIEIKTSSSNNEKSNEKQQTTNLNNLQFLSVNNNNDNIYCRNYLNSNNKNYNSNPQIAALSSDFKALNNKNINSTGYSPNENGGKRGFYPNSARNNTGDLTNKKCMENIFKSENLISNDNLNSHNMEKPGDSRLSKLTSLTNEKKKISLRPRIINGIEFKFSPNIKQETYKSVQNVLDTNTSYYFPFSKKRCKQSELEKQSYHFQNKVEMELKRAKKREVKQIKIKSKNDLSNYLMRDYFFGEKGDTVASSK